MPATPILSNGGAKRVLHFMFLKYCSNSLDGTSTWGENHLTSMEVNLTIELIRSIVNRKRTNFRYNSFVEKWIL